MMQRIRGISGSTLKLIAMASMVIDHAAAVLLGLLLMRNGIYDLGNLSVEYMRGLLAFGTPGYLYIAYQIMRRVIGRIAFPIYCFLLVEGFQRTRSRGKYMLRLFLFSVISEIPFDLAFHGRLFEWNYNNVFFTLLIAFVMMYLWDVVDKKDLGSVRRWLLYVCIFVTMAALAEGIHCDYGAHGIIAVALIYLFRRNKVEQILAGCVAFLWEVTAPLAFLPIAFYRGKRGWSLKYIFYIFYPAHLLLLYLISIKFL